jgi:hypothetical protein
LSPCRNRLCSLDVQRPVFSLCDAVADNADDDTDDDIVGFLSECGQGETPPSLQGCNDCRLGRNSYRLGCRSLGFSFLFVCSCPLLAFVTFIVCSLHCLAMVTFSVCSSLLLAMVTVFPCSYHRLAMVTFSVCSSRLLAMVTVFPYSFPRFRLCNSFEWNGIWMNRAVSKNIWKTISIQNYNIIFINIHWFISSNRMHFFAVWAWCLKLPKLLDTFITS